jgi:hypothetical protein
MRKSILALVIILPLLTSSVFYSCKKQNSGASDQLPPKEMMAKVNAWLEQQKTENKPLKNEKIQRLKDNLNFSGLRYEPYSENEQLIIVPINKSFVSTNHKESSPVNSLVLIADRLGKIRNGNIFQIIPASSQNEIPVNTFSNYYQSKPITFDGKLSILSVTDWLLYEFTYKNGRIEKSGIVEAKQGDRTQSRMEDTECFDWYLVTTTHYPDGTVEEDWEYLYTTCSCIPGTRCDELEGGGGGGTENQCCLPDPNVQLATSAVSESEGLDCGLVNITRTGIETKTCTFTWTFNTNTLAWYSWKYKSFEECKLEKLPGAEWKFVANGVTHTGIGGDGNPPDCVDFSCNVSSASGSTDGTQAHMSLEYTNSFKISCCPWCSTKYTSLSSSATWGVQ